MQTETQQKEITLQQAAVFLCWLRRQFKLSLSSWMVMEAKNSLARDERVLPHLCSLLNAVPQHRLNAMLFHAPYQERAIEVHRWWTEFSKDLPSKNIDLNMLSERDKELLDIKE